MSAVNKLRGQHNPWVIARKITQGLSFLAFIAAIVLSRMEMASHSLLSFPIRLSPLSMLASLISSRTFLAGMTISIVLLLSSLLFGRAWCGWLCPLGTILDIFHFRNKKRQITESMRTVKYGLLIVILFAALFSNLTLLIFDPLTIFTRTVTLAILPAFDSMISAVEKLLFQVPFLANTISQFDQLIRPSILPVEPAVFQYAILTGLFFIGILLLNLVAERFWCRYICPLGAFLALISKAAFYKRRVKENCSRCGLCEAHCPTDTIDTAHNFSSDPAECIMCMNCLQSCQKNALSFSPGFNFEPRREYDPQRRTLLNSFLVSITLAVLLSLEWIKRYPRTHLIRPPGVDRESFSAKCIRCGLCMKVCPTGALQIDLAESGIEAAGTPVLVPRLGFCQYSCNACAQICPVEAIPPISLKEKQVAVIGKAYIDHNRCIAWADHNTCIVCEEMCPLPKKAIDLEPGSFPAADGTVTNIQLPVVNREICIGCGICENKCPVPGEAAIRVYVA